MTGGSGAYKAPDPLAVECPRCGTGPGAPCAVPIHGARSPHLDRKAASLRAVPLSREVWQEVAAERDRAHIKHGASTMESLPVDSGRRLAVLVEEVGEVARALNEAAHKPPLDRAALREELVQVSAMAGAWADALTPGKPDSEVSP